MGYFLFVLVTATLFIRPAEIIPAVYAWPIYNYLILACLAVSIEPVLRQLSSRSLADNPISACVVGLLFAVVLSHLVYLRTWEARYAGIDFLKLVIYYLLLVANVNSEARLKSFFRWLLLLITVATVLALLSAFHVVQLPGVEFLTEQGYDSATGELVVSQRLRSTGIFNDPNDLAMILAAGVAIALCFAADPTAGILRPLGLVLVGLFGYAIYETQSRGGLLALMATLLTLCHARWGWKRTLLIAAVAIPVLLVACKGRITSYDDAMGQGTGRSRVELWSAGLQLFKQRPLFGVGFGALGGEAGPVSHNSFVHAFVELGFFGGALFLGAFVAAFTMLHRLRHWGLSQFSPGETGTVPLLSQFSSGETGTVPGDCPDFRPTKRGLSPYLCQFSSARNGDCPPSDAEDISRPIEGELRRLLPYVTALLVGFATSMFSLSRNYIVPTYMVLGLATAYVQIATGQTQPLLLKFDSWFVKRLAYGGVGFIIFIYLFIRVTARWS